MEKLLNELKTKANGAKIHHFFSPARINLIGEHIDYVGGQVMPAAIDIGITAYACKANNIEIKSSAFGDKWLIDNDHFELKTYDQNQKFFNFVYGVINELRSYLKRDQGFKLILSSKIPIASGLSSSAAFGLLIIEVFCTLYEIKISKKAKAKMLQSVENNFIGVNSGIMDQFAILFGKKDHFIVLNTKTLDYKYVKSNPQDYEFLLISTNKSRELASSKYNERVTELKEVAQIINVPFSNLSSIKDTSITNQITNDILKRRLQHVTSENKRVKMIEENLAKMSGKELGLVLNQSHASLKNDYEVSCPELDFIQSNLQKVTTVYGARMIGAGFGGCILAIVSKQFKINDINFNFQYKAKFGLNFDLYKFKIGGGVKEYD